MVMFFYSPFYRSSNVSLPVGNTTNGINWIPLQILQKWNTFIFQSSFPLITSSFPTTSSRIQTQFMRVPTLFFILAICSLNVCDAQISITVRKSFIDSFKNRLTIDANYEIYFAHKHPNAASKDADLHFAGYERKIGLPIVAEIMNAREVTEAVDLIHAKEGKGVPTEKVPLTGVWRLWCEHPGDIEEFKQGNKNIPIENTNPPHVFEIHPVTKIGGIDVMPTLHRIDGFKYKDAEDAFNRYSNMRCRIRPKTKTVTIETNGIGYNYVDFWIRLNANQHQVVNDGLFAYCTVYSNEVDTTDGSNEEGLIAHKMRIGFVKGSDVFNKVKTMKKGEFLHVVGIPRIDLALVSWRVAHASSRPEVLQWNLPLEMIAVAELN